jgi:hypothetical protein
VALFHATHANLNTTSGLALGTLSTARQSLRKQVGIDGTTILDIPPQSLVVPAALETTGQQLLATLYPHAVADANPFSNTLALVVDPRLDASSATSWYLFADPGMYPVMEYSHLSGQPGLFIETRIGFEVDGFELKARIDYGVGAIDFRGAIKSTA